ncbi:S41 family peptidase [Roseateles cellulosilyticus]|uniref:S41 family peptidase n=1 Tax=Pelomonas cellulosilytica TaxID=2906762 RepID=A0ABS8Y1I1_9BURK|nr:S41 family peptidase [Pelomonas sp. P8]MCE4558173.1 S41 family peptidase [Pelomonas sp. P8]
MLLAPIACAAAFATASPQSLTAAQAREDFDLALAAVEAGLPNITWFQSPQDWKRAKQSARQALHAVHDDVGLFRVLRPLLSRIGEGHLSLQRSAMMRAEDARARGLLPVDLRWTEAGAWVMAGWETAARIPPGTRLLAIDDEPAAELMRESMSALGHDGTIQTGVMRELDGGGYARARQWMRGGADRYRLRLQDAAGTVYEQVVDGIANAARPARVEVVESPVARLEWLDPHIARLVVPTFSNRRHREAGSDYREVVRKAFETLREQGASTLILDLRDNGGGSEGNENYLFSFLVREPLRKYAAVKARGATVSVRDAHGRRYTAEVYDRQELRQQLRTPGDQLSRRNEPPEGLMSHWEARSDVFGGRLIVLAGGNTFSGAAELCSMLYHARRALFVGEEVAGAYAGNTSGYRWNIELPNSHMRLHVPLLQFRFAWNELPLGRGVPADCAAPPDLPGSNRDTALDLALQLSLRPWSHDALCAADLRPLHD